MKKLLILAILLSSSLLAEETQNATPQNLFESAEKSYQNNQHEEAILTLQSLIQAIKLEISKKMIILLPPQTDHWTRSEPEAINEDDPIGAITTHSNKNYFTVSANYQSKTDTIKALVQITNSPQKVLMTRAETQIAFSENVPEAFKKNTPKNAQKLDLMDCTGSVSIDDVSKEVKLILLGYESLILVQCSNTQDPEIAKSLAQSINWNELKKLTPPPPTSLVKPKRPPKNIPPSPQASTTPKTL